jgi:hypothetical protein
MTTHDFPRPTTHTHNGYSLKYDAKDSELKGQTKLSFASESRQDLESHIAPPFNKFLRAPLVSI